MAINQGSIIDHVDKPAIHPDDAVVQSITATESGKLEYTVNGVPTTRRVEARGLIKCDGHATNHISIADGVKSGQEVYIQETGSAENVPLIVRNSSDSAVAIVWPGETCSLKWIFTSTSAGSWQLLDRRFEPVSTYYFNELPSVSGADGTAATGGAAGDAGISVNHFPDGLTWYMRSELAQAITSPEAVASVGIKYDLDDEDNNGFELAMCPNVGLGKVGRTKWVGGTSATNAPGFYAEVEVSCADVSETETITLLGMGIVEAMPDAALVTARNTYAAFAIDDGDQNIDIKEELDGSSAGSDASGTALTDNAAGSTKCKITWSDAGLPTMTLNGSDVSKSNFDLQLAANDEITVFFNLVKTAASAAGLIFKKLTVGYN
jgi:hypothetical protein